jgi:ATP-dependent DNA helicase RecG
MRSCWRALPFQLTAAQQRVGAEIAHRPGTPAPMHRLLQGDVGSGKTVVAALAAAACIDAGCQCALMAPTEILAEQHFPQAHRLAGAAGHHSTCLADRQPEDPKERRAMLALIASGEAALVVGTHADDPGQGAVQQPGTDGDRRAAPLWRGPAPGAARQDGTGAGAMEPHLLMMTATPIPRTLAMSYYADLDVSTIDELPPGRTPIVTKVVNASARDEVDGAHPGPAGPGPAGLLGLPADRGERGAGPDAMPRPPMRH